MLVSSPSSRAQGLVDRIQQCILTERFAQVIYRALPDGSRARLLFRSMRGDEDNRNFSMAGHQVAVKFNPTHPGHTHIQYQAVRIA